MSTLYVPQQIAPPAQRQIAARGWPWRTGLILLVLFAMANWSWSFGQRWYNTSNAGEVDQMIGEIAEGQFVRQLAFVTMAMLGVASLLIGGGRQLQLKWILAYPVILFVGWAFLSIAWSIDPMLAAKRLLVFAAIVMAVVHLLRHFDIRQLAEIALIAAGLTLVACTVNEIRLALSGFPGYAVWRFGGMLHPNHTGLTCGMVMLSSLYLSRYQRKAVMLTIFVVTAGVLFLTKSRTAMSATLVAITVFLMLSSRGSRVATMLLLAAWIVAGLMWFSSIGESMDVSRVLTMGRDDVKDADIRKLTGRTDIWKFALMQAAKNPNREFIGYGYETFWTPDNVRGVSEFVKFKIPEGHNLYLDWYLELGFVGVALFVLALLTAIWRWASAAVYLKSPAAALAAAVLCGTIIHGFAESSLGDASLPTLMVYAAIAGATILRPDEETGI